jgi:hypothetical protein
MKVVDNQKLVALMASDQFSKIPAADLAMILSDQAVQSMLVNDSFMKLADEARFTEALKVPAFDQLLRAGDLAKVLPAE